MDGVPALRAVSDAVLAVAARRSVDEVLQQLVESARELAGARYAALGVPDDAGGFSRFLVSGMSDELIARLGPLPRTHGLLGAMLEASEPYRTDDLHRDPRFRGWWPAGHPDMRSFLGVPIVAPEGVIGAFYLTEKEGGGAFSGAEQELIELLAAHAAIAITNARLYEHSRELSILSERNRLALELHDAVSQKLFGLVLSADAAGTLLDRDPVAAGVQLQRLRRLAREALDELRVLVLELRPPELERDGLRGTLRKHVRSCGVARRRDRVATCRAPRPSGADATARSCEWLRRPAQRRPPRRRAHIEVRLGDGDGRLLLEVRDDGAASTPDDPSCARGTWA
jgi:GAF domain-containing protein